MKLLLAYILAVIAASHCISLSEASNRTFAVDWEHDQFLKDGKPFRFIAGSFHYFRAHPQTWQRKLRTMRAAGLNAVTTYVEWSLHNPSDGKYVWTGIADLERFIKLAIVEDLLVILRPGPYICAERDNGGFPYWLLAKYPNMLLRTGDINYLYEVRIWYSQLMARMGNYLYGNGGPIIMVQVENEYGSYFACDKNYRNWLRDETLARVQNKAVLFTNDGPSVLRCGHIEGVLATMDFGVTSNLNNTWRYLRRIQPKGPLVNAEYYPGWLTHWTERMARVRTRDILKTFTEMLDDGASVNFYMFYGGTNFGFTAGANDGGPGRYQPDITSYDYDAPIDEAGDPTSKYHALREVIGRYLPLPDIPVPEPLPKRKYGKISLDFCCTLLSQQARKLLSKGKAIAAKPLTFEMLNQYSGLILYETWLPAEFGKEPSILSAKGLRDRAYIYVDEQFVGLMTRQTPVYEIPLNASSAGKKLQMFVENQGRINFGFLHDFKGLVSDVLLEKQALANWNMTKFPLESYEDIESLIAQQQQQNAITADITDSTAVSGNKGPSIFYGDLIIEDNDNGQLYDSYIDTRGWSKGIIFVNGENMGRYWPLAGPQMTLYVPREVLKLGRNKIVLLEYQDVAIAKELTFTDKPNFND